MHVRCGGWYMIHKYDAKVSRAEQEDKAFIIRNRSKK